MATAICLSLARASVTAPMSDNPRLLAVRALVKIYSHAQTLDQALPGDTKPIVRELVSGTLRHHFSLSERIDELLTRKLRSKDRDVHCLLLVGAYQLLHTRIPDHAAVAETVACTKDLKKPWAKGLVNAVLRNLPPPTEEWSPAAHHDHPHWFINLLRNSLPDQWFEILAANNTRAPMTLRVNCARTTVDDYLKLLQAAEIEFETGALPETLNLKKPRPQKSLPGFNEGLVAVQDAAAQLAVCVAQATKEMRVLDACSAPGGKGFHLLEQTPGIRLRMQDISEPRISTLREQAERLGHDDSKTAGKLEIAQSDSSAEVQNADKYDLILLDAPCSGSGTVRRHPDIKVLREEFDLKALNTTQADLLDALWRKLTPGGRLIYSTCSVFNQENDEIIESFLKRRENERELEAEIEVKVGSIAARMPTHLRTPFVVTTYGVQTLPTLDGGDGLYYAELVSLPAMQNGPKQ